MYNALNNDVVDIICIVLFAERVVASGRLALGETVRASGATVSPEMALRVEK